MTKGQRISHYTIDRLLGKGGMGEVYLAHDTVLDRDVAIKFLPDPIQHDPGARERFLREAKSAAALDHPFICQIYETGMEGGKTYIVMEYVEGCTLSKKLSEGPLPLKDALNTAYEVAEALEIAHAKGIVHRDLKPANIMCTPQGHVKVMDFGLAKKYLPGGESISATITQSLTPEAMTQAGQIVGTIDHMSPEQAKGETVDPRSDIFSLGIILYELVVGKNPFERPSPVETLSAVIRDPIPTLALKPKSAGPALQPILKKCLAKKRTERYANVAQLAEDLRKLRDKVSSGLMWKKWASIGAAAAVVILAAVSVWKFVLAPKKGAPPAAPEPVSVLLADVQNRTGNPIFDGVLETVLSVNLDGATYISLYDGKQARQRAPEFKPGAERLDMDVALLLSRSEGINAVVSGSIENASAGFLLKIWAVDPANGSSLANVAQSLKDQNAIFNVVKVMTAELQGNLVKMPPESKEIFGQETFTTTSLQAVQTYSTAQRLDAEAKYEEAAKEYLHTLDYDPNFGRAYAGLAAIYYSQGDLQKADEYYQKALKFVDHMTDREKFRTRGGYALFKFDYRTAVDQYAALVNRYPKDAVGHAMLAFAYYQGRQMDKAFEEGSASVKHNPRHISPRYNICWYALATGQFPKAEQESQSLMNDFPKFAEGYLVHALSEIAQGRIAPAEETYRRLEAVSPGGKTIAQTGLADIALYEGRGSEAVKILEAGLAYDIKNDRKDIAADKALILAQIHDSLGKLEAAVRYADQALQLSDQGHILVRAGEIYIHGRKDDKAREIQGKLAKQIQLENQAYAKLLGGCFSLTRGEAANACNLFRESLALVDSWIGRLDLGKAFLEAGAFAEAQAEFETCLKRGGETSSVFLNDLPTFRYLPQVYYYLGRAQEGLGSAGAKASYEKFLKIMEKADAGDALIAAARSRLKNP